MAFPANVQPTLQGFANKHVTHLHWQHHGKPCFIRHHPADRLYQFREGKVRRIPSHAPACIWGQGILCIIRWIAEDKIESFRLLHSKPPDVVHAKLYPVSKGTCNGVFPCLLHTGSINVNSRYLCRGTSLCRHQRNKATTATHIQYAWLMPVMANLHICPCAKQHRISANTHRTSAVPYLEFLEFECLTCHNRETNILLLYQ